MLTHAYVYTFARHFQILQIQGQYQDSGDGDSGGNNARCVLDGKGERQILRIENMTRVDIRDIDFENG